MPVIYVEGPPIQEVDKKRTLVAKLTEAAVEAFLDGRIGFGEIVPLVEMILNRTEPGAEVTLEDLLAADVWARRQVGEMISTAAGERRAGERQST